MQHVDFRVHVMPLGLEVRLRGSAMLPNECCSVDMSCSHFPFHPHQTNLKIIYHPNADRLKYRLCTNLQCTCVHLNLDLSNSVPHATYVSRHGCLGLGGNVISNSYSLPQSILHSHSHFSLRPLSLRPPFVPPLPTA